MSPVLLAGLALNALFSWWRADQLAAVATMLWTRGEANEAIRAARTGQRCAAWPLSWQIAGMSG